MRILNLGGTYLVSALKGLGHEVVSLGLSPDCTWPVNHPVSIAWLTAQLAQCGFEPDACFMCDNGNLPLLIGQEHMPCPSLFYSIDTFCNPWHIPYSYAFDQTLVAQEGHVAPFPLAEPKAAWMPLFAPDMPPCDPDAERDIPVAFVGTLQPGNIPERLPFLQAFRRIEPLFFKQGNYAPIFGRAQIVLNQTAASEVNFRCFEAMACGAALLTEYSPHGMDKLFTPGVDILPLYARGDAAGAAAIARDWLRRPDELRQLAAAGYARVRKLHSASQRAATVAQALAALVATQAHRPRLEQMNERRRLLATAYAILADELAAPHLAPHRDLYARLFLGMV